MYSDKLDPIEWYVIFSRAKVDHWIFKIIHKDFGHVYAVKSLNDYQWLVIQPRLNLVDAQIKLKSQYPHIRMIAGPDARVLKVEVIPGPGQRGSPCWFSCVEQVKALIGMKSFFTITPKQLYDRLVGK